MTRRGGVPRSPGVGRFKLGKTNPNLCTSGLHATVGAFFAATGVASDLTVAQVQDPATAEYVRRLESTVVHYGDTTLTFLDNLLTADAEGQGLTYVSAVTVEEKSVLDYNAGNRQRIRRRPSSRRRGRRWSRSIRRRGHCSPTARG
jgi:Ca-activated chloride channel homolog